MIIDWQKGTYEQQRAYYAIGFIITWSTIAVVPPPPVVGIDSRFDEVYFDQARFDRQIFARFRSDSGSGVEALGSRVFGAGETGGGIEALLFRLIGRADSGLGVDYLSAISKFLIALELGRGTERLVAKIESASKEGTIRLPPATGAMTIPGKQVGMSSKEVSI